MMHNEDCPWLNDIDRSCGSEGGAFVKSGDGVPKTITLFRDVAKAAKNSELTRLNMQIMWSFYVIEGEFLNIYFIYFLIYFLHPRAAVVLLSSHNRSQARGEPIGKSIIW